MTGAILYVPYLAKLPDGIHAWAQADRLALAINFYDYGFQFFTPRTSNLSSIGGITGVEFPLQAYLAALGGLVFGRENIGILFRLLDVAMVLLGFFYLFRLVYERTGNFVAGLVPGVFLLVSPAFGFYAVSTLPDPFSLSLSFIGYYYWLRFMDRRQFADLLTALLVLGLAALIKTTVLLHLGAVLGITSLWCFLYPDLLSFRQRLYFLGVALGVLGAIAGVYFRTQYLNATYQSSMFLAEARPITDPQTRHEVVRNVHNMWSGQYAALWQYAALGIAGGLLVVFARRNLRHYLPLTLLLLAALAVAGLFVQLMGAQFRDHDYYMICSLFPPAILLLLLALLNLGRYQGTVGRIMRLGLAVLVVFSLVRAYKHLHRRMSDDYPPFTPYGHLWMRGGAAELARLHVPATATILLFNEPAPNLGPVYFDRRGQIWQAPDTAQVTADALLKRMAIDHLDYLIMAPAVYARLAPQHAALAAGFELVGQQPAVVLRRRNHRQPW
ncbi:glycosyltransferase family 39 protein [Hymenobacter sp. M29]|uniref:Glycosyltransferase family 39 protein n=1 Tax=Hymenobacter mellowenesis TaxID=3063995 RepID=A0ABT9A5Y2_9BACT|nr:glycosyltransferase family 39 protein [Hymenobacter sp. M29]MDO7845250.1 glycosyltransferase family 39 protein [Hymenobacter sp. M29]